MIPKDIIIRRANLNDRDAMINIYMELLFHMDQFDYELLPTRSNAEFIIDNFIIPRISKDDPIYLGQSFDQIVAMIAWITLETPLETRYKQAHEQIIYVKPEFRKKGISSELRRIAKNHALKSDIDVIMTSPLVNNDLNKKINIEQGFKHFAKILMLKLK